VHNQQLVKHAIAIIYSKLNTIETHNPDLEQNCNYLQQIKNNRNTLSSYNVIQISKCTHPATANNNAQWTIYVADNVIPQPQMFDLYILPENLAVSNERILAIDFEIRHFGFALFVTIGSARFLHCSLEVVYFLWPCVGLSTFHIC